MARSVPAIVLVLAAAARGLVAPRRVRVPRTARSAPSEAGLAEVPDYLVTDSFGLEDRPSLVDAVANPRDALAIALLAVGARVSLANVAGAYDEAYVAAEVAASGLGVASCAAAAAQVATGYKISGNRRPGVADDRVVTAFGGAYSLAVSWLAARASDACPPGLGAWDAACGPAAGAVFAFGAVAPAATLLGVRAPELSETERLRVGGLVAIGILGAVFVPDCVAFAVGSDAWWDRVAAAHPAQTTLESSTALFALFATEASMVAHRAGKAGVAPFAAIVPAFVAVCFALAVAPCAAALFWLGSDVSFFSFYRE